MRTHRKAQASLAPSFYFWGYLSTPSVEAAAG